MGYQHWTLSDTQALARLYPDTSNEVLGRVFGRPAMAIGLKARSMGLKKSEQFMASTLAQSSKLHLMTVGGVL